MITVIVSPQGEIFSGETAGVTLFSSKGSMTILNNHAPLLSDVKAGELTLQLKDKELRYKVADGFLEVSHNKATVLVESVQELN